MDRLRLVELAFRFVFLCVCVFVSLSLYISLFLPPFDEVPSYALTRLGHDFAQCLCLRRIAWSDYKVRYSENRIVSQTPRSDYETLCAVCELADYPGKSQGPRSF